MITPRPLVGMDYVKTVLDRGEDSILKLAENGMLTPVWQIQACVAKRKELRFLNVSLIYYAGTSRPLPADPDAICADLFPANMPVTTASLCRTLNCGGDLVCDLVKSKAIALEPGEALRAGRGGAARVNRASAIAFMADRLYL